MASGKSLTIAADRHNREEVIGYHKESFVIILPLEYSYNSSIRSSRIKTNLSADSRQKKDSFLSYLSVRVSHANQNTHKDAHTEAVSGTTEVLWVAVSQALFLEAMQTVAQVYRDTDMLLTPVRDSHIDLTCSARNAIPLPVYLYLLTKLKVI